METQSKLLRLFTQSWFTRTSYKNVSESFILLPQAQKQTRRALKGGKGKKTARRTQSGCGYYGAGCQILSTCFDTYPGYDGDIEFPNGSHAVIFFDDEDFFRFRFNLRGLEANCANCGIAIHTGTSCDDVGDTFWNGGEDPWTIAGGSVYNSDADGNAMGSFETSNGFDSEANLDHAVVIYNANEDPIGCGVLSKSRKAAKSCNKSCKANNCMRKV